ncbi:MAG: hypothetical protein AAFR87_11375 [Bacteroidota bacterium]
MKEGKYMLIHFKENLTKTTQEHRIFTDSFNLIYFISTKLWNPNFSQKHLEEK